MMTKKENNSLSSSNPRRNFIKSSAIGEQVALDVLSKWPIPEYAHEKLQPLFNRYTLIGGMPAVVANYAQNNAY